jgi:hypothetical protein
LFGRTETLYLITFKLPFSQHVHQFDAGEGSKDLNPHRHRSRHPLHPSVILLHNVVEIFDLADFNRRAVLLVVALDRRFVGRTS